MRGVLDSFNAALEATNALYTLYTPIGPTIKDTYAYCDGFTCSSVGIYLTRVPSLEYQVITVGDVRRHWR